MKNIQFLVHISPSIFGFFNWWANFTHAPLINSVGYFFHMLIIALVTCTAVPAVSCFGSNPKIYLFCNWALNFLIHLGIQPKQNAPEINIIIYSMMKHHLTCTYILIFSLGILILLQIPFLITGSNLLLVELVIVELVVS